MPQALALSDYALQVPPPALQLQRIARYLGVPESKRVQTSAQTPEETMRAVLAAGLQVTEARPDDPMLDLLDD